AADIDHAQLDIRLDEQRKHPCGTAYGAVPLTEIGLLRADMEGNAIGVETKIPGSTQELNGHLRSAAEFTRQWPLGTLAGDENAAEYLRARRRTCQLVELVGAVKSKQPQTGPVGEGDVLFFFYSIAER